MMSEEISPRDLSSSGNCAIPYADENVTSAVVNVPPRLGRSRLFAKEELMYATNHNAQQYQPRLNHQQFPSNSNSNFRGPLPKTSISRVVNSPIKSSIQERSANFQRKSKQSVPRRVSCKDAVDNDDDNPLQRYENALLRYRKPNPGGLGGLRKDRREAQNISNNGYSSSDSECAITRYNKSKSTSSIDTQSVNNILDEYEDLDCGRSSDLSDSGSISVTNFEAVMDQRKRQQQQQQQHQHQQQYDQVERSNHAVTDDEDIGAEGGGQQHQQPEKHHDQRARIQIERPETVFKVNQQTQVRQRSRDRQSSVRDASSKINSSSDEPSRSRNEASTVTSSDNRPTNKQPPEILLRKGEVQKRVDEWLNQAQSQNFVATNTQRETSRIVALVRSSSSAESKNSRRSRNDARSRSTDENSGERLNGTASYDDINRTEATRTERKVERGKNIPANNTRGTYKEYLAVRNRTRHPTDYGFVQGAGRTTETSIGSSRIPQRGNTSVNLNSRRRQVVDDNVEEYIASSTSATSTPTKQEKNSSRSTRMTPVESRIATGFVKTRPENLSSNGATVGTASTPIYANGRSTSFKRARSHERNTGIAAVRCTGVLVKEDQPSGNTRMRGSQQQQQQQQQFVSKGQHASSMDQPQQQAIATSPNKVGESRRLLVAGRQSRVRDDPIEGACSKSSEGTLLQQRIETNEKEEESVAQRNEELTKFIVNRNRSDDAKDADEETSRMIDNSIDNPSQSSTPRGTEELRTPRTSRLTRENSDGVEQSRRPPAPPRRDQSRRDKTEHTTGNDQQVTDRLCSSFRPNKRMYSALRQLNEQNSFTGARVNESHVELSEAKPTSHYASPKRIEKIYEKSTSQSRVIHSNDLESLLKPIVRASAYGEASENDTTTRIKDSLTIFDENDTENGKTISHGITELIGEKRASPRNSRYPEIGFDQCLIMQQRSPSVKIGKKDVPSERRDLPILRTKSSWERDEVIVNEVPKTFGTFQPGNTIHSPVGANDRIDKKIGRRESEDIDEAVVIDACDEPTYQELDLLPTINISMADSYEARSTLRLDRNIGCTSRDSDNCKNDTTHCDLGEEEKSQIFDSKPEVTTSENFGTSNYPGNSVDTKLFGCDEKKSFSRENTGDERGAVVNEVLVKNLRFQQDVPKNDLILRQCGPIIASKPFNFNSVLSDDYEKIQAGDCGTIHSEETKIYVTKEEMERQKMMDLLRRGDYEAVQMGADRVCPSTTGGKHSSGGAGNGSRGASTPITSAQDLPLESLWAAGLDEGMGFPQRCSYANHRTLPNNASNNQTHSANPEELWRDRNLSYRTPTTSTGIGSSINDEIWTSANERKFFRTSTTSTGIGSSLNLQDNNRSLESRDDDFYPTDVDESKDGYRKYYPTTPTTSGLGSSSERQSVETQRSGDLPDHLWAAAMEDGFSRFNAMKSLQTITRQPRPNHDWVKTERISRFTKHRTISQSPQREQEIWTSRLNEINVSGYATQRIPQHRCHHQTRRSFSTSIVADLAGTPNTGSQQSLGSGEFLELERSYTLSTPGGGSPVCCPPCSPPPAPAAYISSVRASSRRLATGNGLGGPTSPDRDPLGKLLRYLKTFYRELGTRDPRHLPPWASPLPLGTLCPAHFQPHLQLVHKSEQEHRLENIKIDQIFAPVRLSDGTISEAPRRVAVEGGPGSGRTTLCLRLLHHWATQGDGPALAFMVPLRELRGGPLLNYLARELFPRTSALGDAVTQVWRTLHLMEDRVLFVLDGYDECLGGRASLGDAADLLEGRLFPDARILVTCSPTNSSTLSPLVQRRIHLAGLEWSHVERLCVAYFIHNDLAERACEFLEALNIQPTPVKQLVQHPLGWVMLCALYQDSGSLPTETSSLVQAAIKCIVRRSLDRPVPHDEEIPGHCRKRLEDFGKLSLAALREGRCCYTEAELRSRGGGIEVTRLGFLSRGLTFGQRRKADLYTPIHMSVAEFLAAYYLTSVAQYANILRRELEGLPSGIIGHLAGLLGPKTHLILNQLCPLEVPPRMVFSLLKAAGASDGNIAAVCRLVGAGPGFGPAPNDRPPAPLVQTSPLELEGWTRILESSACTLEALEIVFQVERGSDPCYLNEFFDALAENESVKLVRITSLLGQEFPADEAQRLAGHLKCVLSKKRLNDFELVITCLEESAHDRLECVVNALCRGLGHASNNLARLVLDMNLSGDQVSRVCEALRDCVQVQALHLPHLSCGCEGLASVAELLKERPLLALNLAGSWGAKNEDPSSSGISMGSGSGSGSSGCASSTLGTLPLNRCYSSLPRGALAAYGSMTRPATLPRLPLGLGLGPNTGNGNGPLPTNDRDRDSNGSSKRNSDSVLCHRLPLMHPLPTCDVTSHQGTGFHEIFNAIREPNCKLRSLNVSKCLQGGLDAGCLGETIRRARYLDALRASGASRPADVMPLVLALTEAPCLQLLDLASPRLALDDHPSRLLCHALARNCTLRLLSLEGWTFRIEESESLAVFSELLMCTSVRELSLSNARLHLAVHEGPLSRLGRRDDAGAELLRAAPPPACPTIVFLRLAGFQVTVNDRPALRGPLLLPFLAGFTALTELDLSLDKSEIGGSSSSLLFIDDKILQHFFVCLSSNFKSLQSLCINYWRISLEDSERTMRHISKNLKLCNLSFLKVNGLIVTDSAKKVQMEHLFLQTILANLQNLTWLCLDGVKITDTQASSVGKCIRDRYPGTSLEISAKDIHVKSIKALVTAVEDGGRAEVVYTGGSCCRLKITKIQKNSKGKKK